MTKRHFEAIAAIFNARLSHYTTSEDDQTLIYTIALEQANYFAMQNFCFDRTHFLTACGF